MFSDLSLQQIPSKIALIFGPYILEIKSSKLPLRVLFLVYILDFDLIFGSTSTEVAKCNQSGRQVPESTFELISCSLSVLFWFG